MSAIEWVKVLFIASMSLWLGYRIGKAVGRNESLERLRVELAAENRAALRIIRGGGR